MVEAAGEGGGGAEVEAAGQGVGGGEAESGTRETMRASFGAFVSIAEGGAEGEGRGGLPASGEERGPSGDHRGVSIPHSVDRASSPFGGSPIVGRGAARFRDGGRFPRNRVGCPPIVGVDWRAG